MKALLALLLVGCTVEAMPHDPKAGSDSCASPVFTADECRPIDQAGGTVQCEIHGEGSAWVFYGDGSYVNVELETDGSWKAEDTLCRVASDGSTWFGW